MANSKWIRLKTTCKREYLDTVSAVMEMIDNGIMIEDYSDIEDLLDGVYGDLIDETTAACTHTGMVAHYECADCHKFFVKENGAYVATSEQKLTIPVTQHVFAREVAEEQYL